MNFNSDLYDLTQNIGAPLFRAYIAAQQALDPPPPAPPPLARLRRGRAESPGWFLIQALEFDPEPLTVANLRVRDIYASERIVAALLELMASEKWLDSYLTQRGERAYILTADGRSRATDRVETLRTAVAQGDYPLTPAELTRLAALMGQVITASLEAGDPPGNWCLQHSRQRAPAPDAPASVQLLQYAADFNAYRDDAHMAAWQPLEISGHGWEAFTFVTDGQADTASAIDRQLHYRGFTAAEYEAELQKAVERDWLLRTEEGH